MHGAGAQGMSTFFYRFFFSSRTRHTSWPRDWSSDVCSSDLCVAAARDERASARKSTETGEAASAQERSEERRVGKEWRERWGARQQRNTKREGGAHAAEQNRGASSARGRGERV